MVRVGYARVGFALGMYISCCLCQFHSHWVANANAISGGRWAQVVHFEKNRSKQKQIQLTYFLVIRPE